MAEIAEHEGRVTEWAADTKDRARLMDATYAQATAHAGMIESVALTADALNLGLDFALLESVVRARPAGAGRGGAIRYRIRIIGRGEELCALRRLKLA